ncbi:MAG: redoxin domain-containing protein [Terracidiphilus sp.]
MQFTQLLQAPPGTKTDWESLRGKVVVLEFWMTQCEPCIAEIPHLSKLIAELDPAKFQIISVDGLAMEDEQVVQKFLTKRKMPGWVGVDTTGGVAASYGVRVYPTTIIVDGKGRIVAVTSPQELTVPKLQAVAEGKTVMFQTLPDMSALAKAAEGKTVRITRMLDMEGLQKLTSPASDGQPLLEFSLTKAPPDAQNGMSFSGGLLNFYGWNARALISYAYRIESDRGAGIPQPNVLDDRFLSTSVFPEGHYNLHVAWLTGEDNDKLIAPFLQTAITCGLKLQVESKTVAKKVFLLKAIDANHKLLTPTASTGGSKWGYENGKLELVNRSVDDLANGVEGRLEVPVINETGIEGKFDAELEFPAKDADAAKAALKTIGLELIEAERPIQMLEVSTREGTKKVEEAKPQVPPQK